MTPVKSIEQGWVVVAGKNTPCFDPGEIAHDTFFRTRKQSIEDFCDIWPEDSPRHNWSWWYRRGVRCVRATRTVRVP